jgi:hypothetical protein
VGHLSNIYSATAHIAEDDPQPISAVKRLEGVFAEGGDIDTYAVDLVEGDVLTVTGKVDLSDRFAEIGLALDLWDPEGVSLSMGRYPEDGKREGVRKFVAGQTGLHVLVVRPYGFDAKRGTTYALRVRIRHSRGSLRMGGESVSGVIAFAAARGGTVAGIFRGTSAGSALLAPPGATPVEVGLSGKSGVRVLPGTPLDGPTGTWELRFGLDEAIQYRLRVRLPRPRRVQEVPDLAGP